MLKMKLYTKPWFWLVLAMSVFLVNQLPFLVDIRPVMYDEAWYGNTAYNFTQGKGFLNTVVGTRGNSNFLLPLLTAGFMRVFGYSLLSIRLTAVFCGVMTLVFLSLCMKQLRMSWKAQALAFLLFVSLPLFNTVFRFGRPECAALMCMAGGLWFYLRYREDTSWPNMVGMSVFAGLAGCAHPYALLLFALLGVDLLVKVIKGKDKKGALKLLLLLLVAVASVMAVAWVSRTYNGAEESYVKDRFSIKGIESALPVYFKGAFLSKMSLSFLPLLAIIIVEFVRDNGNRVLALVALVHFLIFPFMFSSDLMMAGLGMDYVALIGAILAASLLERLMTEKKRWAVCGFCLYCVFCLGVSYYFNYGSKYERANTVLSKELPKVVSEGAKVFGPIRQWPVLMQTDYQSDHTGLPIEQIEAYDFFILNTQDTVFYSSYKAFLPIDESKLQLVYEKLTKQYGKVQVYKVK